MSDEERFKFEMVLLSVQAGLCDERLDEVESALRRRRELLQSEKAASLNVGDVVTVSVRVSPKKLAGARVRVTGFEGNDKIKGTLLSDCSTGGSYKWRSGSTITLPKNLLGTVVTRAIEGTV